MSKKKMKLPSRFSFGLLYTIIIPRIKKQNTITINSNNVNQTRSPRLILSNHPSATDFIYCSMVLKRRFNCVTGREHLINRKTGWILKRLAVIPKKLFNPDSNAIRMMLKAAKSGNDILLMPEGRLSTAGTNGRSPEGIEKLVKKLGIDVVTINIKGAYLAKGKWCRVRRCGPIQVDAEIALTKEQLTTMTTDDIGKCLNEKLSYDEFAWLEANPNVHYHCKQQAEGLENLFYICPNCHQEFTFQPFGHLLRCQKCQFTLEHTSRYVLLHEQQPYRLANIRDWMAWQFNEAKQLLANGYVLKAQVRLEKAALKGKKQVMLAAGEGICRLSLQGLEYEGLDMGQTVKYQFHISNLPTLTFSCGKNFEIYRDNDYYLFTPLTNPCQAVKWSLFTEAAYEIYNSKNNNNDGIK